VLFAVGDDNANVPVDDVMLATQADRHDDAVSVRNCADSASSMRAVLRISAYSSTSANSSTGQRGTAHRSA
jgi:hypothetical protein